MRLLKTKTERLEFEEFGGNDTPVYAILSHTWGIDEVSLQDIKSHSIRQGLGYEKIIRIRSIAEAHGFEYVWIDTCCIDKTSSTELSEAINSMYRWYQQSGMCYAYLADVSSDTINEQTRAMDGELAKSKWFTRGWTLQELIAPSVLIFLDHTWHKIGTKSSLRQTISDITGIPVPVLQGQAHDLENASVAQRMSWASKRETTRPEDIAYCLMGIFGVNMPMLYGEGERAFLRLQEEIMRASDDHSLFAWESSDRRGGLLATSPAAFGQSSKIIPRRSSSTTSGAITLNNKGIHLKVPVLDVESTYKSPSVALIILPCRVENGDKELVGICMESISKTNNEYFGRRVSESLEFVKAGDFSKFADGDVHVHVAEKVICVRHGRLGLENQSPLWKAIDSGNENMMRLLLEMGADPGVIDRDGLTPLWRAAQNRHRVIMKLLIGKGARLEKRLLSRAAAKGNEAVLEMFLEEGAQPEQEFLREAALNGHEGTVRLLLEKGSQPDGDLLPIAAQNGHEAVIKLLLKKGVRLDRRSLLSATSGRHEAVVKLLLREGIRPDEEIVQEAARQMHVGIFKLLHEKCYGLRGISEINMETLLDFRTGRKIKETKHKIKY